MGILVTVLILLGNTGFVWTNKFFVERVGFKYKSNLFGAQMITLALSLFAHTGLVLLLASANFEGTPLFWIPNINNGQYTDYQNEWYLTVGKQIVVTMMINSITPYINFLISYIFRAINKCRDGGLNRKK